MSISLAKGGTISLAKNNGLDKVRMGLGWDAAKAGGFFGRMLGGAAPDIDLDASVIVFDGNGGILDTVWFRQLVSKDGSIRHSGDNRTGDGEGDDETISVSLSRLPANAQSLVFTVNSFTGQNFNQVENATCRLVDERGNQELCSFKLSDKGSHTGVIMAVLTRKSGEWVMRAIGETTNGRVVGDLARDAARYI